MAQLVGQHSRPQARRAQGSYQLDHRRVDGHVGEHPGQQARRDDRSAIGQLEFGRQQPFELRSGHLAGLQPIGR
ncbi:hypothetical protein [Fodinicola feengrottensis]|uniref:hypothetical protein n=1 Tax=Fodinicola feengrottensis TaxID=435914 RepID=UPI002440F67A|nr:hypothetical protein [Fodinicola feengrottensis]